MGSNIEIRADGRGLARRSLYDKRRPLRTASQRHGFDQQFATVEADAVWLYHLALCIAGRLDLPTGGQRNRRQRLLLGFASLWLINSNLWPNDGLLRLDCRKIASVRQKFHGQQQRAGGSKKRGSQEEDLSTRGANLQRRVLGTQPLDQRTRWRRSCRYR